MHFLQTSVLKHGDDRYRLWTDVALSASILSCQDVNSSRDEPVDEMKICFCY